MTTNKREKMCLSGASFEIYVKERILSSVTVRTIVKENYEFYSPDLGRGRETDLIVIKPQAVYCIECKNYKPRNPRKHAFIKGNEYDLEWQFASSGYLGYVENPYMLNKRRIRCIQGSLRQLDYPVLDIKNIVVVPDQCKVVSDCNSVMNLTTLQTLLSLEDSQKKSTISEKSKYHISPRDIGVDVTSKILDTISYKVRY